MFLLHVRYIEKLNTVYIFKTILLTFTCIFMVHLYKINTCSYVLIMSIILYKTKKVSGIKESCSRYKSTFVKELLQKPPLLEFMVYFFFGHTLHFLNYIDVL